MNFKFIIIIVLFVLTSMAVNAVSFVDRIIAFDSTNGTDTQITQGGADTVRGDDPTISIHDQGGGFKVHSLINYSFLVAGGDYIPTGATCDELNLEFQLEQLVAGAEPADVHMFPNLVEWGEQRTTWNNYNGGGVNGSQYDGNHNFISGISADLPTSSGDRWNWTVNIVDCQAILDNSAGNRSEQSFFFIHPASEAAGSGKLSIESTDASTAAKFMKVYISYTEAVDSTPPVVKVGFNITNPIVGDVINFTGNITDDEALASAVWIVNLTTGTIFLNYTISGLSAEVSNTTEFISAGVFNFTLNATDVTGNVHSNSTLITVLDVIPPQITLINLTSEGGLGQLVNLSDRNCTGVGSFCPRTNDTTPTFRVNTSENAECSVVDPPVEPILSLETKEYTRGSLTTCNIINGRKVCSISFTSY